MSGNTLKCLNQRKRKKCFYYPYDEMKKRSLMDIFTFLSSLRWMKILSRGKRKKKGKRNNLIDTSWILGLSLSTYRSHFQDVRNGNFKKLFYRPASEYWILSPVTNTHVKLLMSSVPVCGPDQ